MAAPAFSGLGRDIPNPLVSPDLVLVLARGLRDKPSRPCCSAPSPRLVGGRVAIAVDPRAKILKVYAQQLTQETGNPHYEIAVEVENMVKEHYADKGIWPNVDFFSGIVYADLGIPDVCFTPIFAMARVSGWLSHWLEQLENNRIFRPTQRCVGGHDQPYVPITQR